MGFSELNDADQIKKRLFKGYRKIARKQGYPTAVYRPLNPFNPFDTLITVTPAVITNATNFNKSSKHGNSSVIGVFDGTDIQEGDYMICAKSLEEDFSNGIPINANVYYVAALDINNPFTLIQCCRTITISRVVGASANGAVKGNVGYSGIKPLPTGEENLLVNWKASILQGTKGENNPAKLPLDVRMPWWTIYLPLNPGVVIDTGDIVRCDLGRKYTVSSSELTNLGWRLTVADERT